MSTPPFLTYPLFTPRDAIASHVRWKITLQLAITLREPLSERALYSIRHPEECAIRQWLVSPHTLHLRSTPAYQAALDHHAAFHRRMQVIADLIQQADFAAAAAQLRSADFQHVSSAIANAIMALQQSPPPARPTTLAP